MPNESHGVQRAKASQMPNLDLIEANLALDRILADIQVMPRADLLALAGAVAELTELNLSKPFDRHSDDELRESIARVAQTAHKGDSELLNSIGKALSFVEADAINNR